MQKKQFLFHASKEDQRLIAAIDNCIAVSMSADKAGNMRVFCFAIRVAQELLVASEAEGSKFDLLKDLKRPWNSRCKIVKTHLEPVNYDRLKKIAEGLGKSYFDSDKPVKLQHAMRGCLRLAIAWIIQYSEQAERVNNGALEELMRHAFVHCSNPGDALPIGPSAFINGMIQFSEQVQKDRESDTA